MEKYWFKDLTKEQVIHAPTLEIAEKLCCKFHELGLKWHSGASYLEDNFWRINKEETCYNFTTGLQGSISYYEKNDYEILSVDQILDFDEPLKLEAGKFYKTRDGRKVRIYSVDSGGVLPVHGAVKDKDSTWVINNWKEGGKHNDEESQFCLDIVEEWVDELEFDVSVIPTFRYLAMGANKNWTMYPNKPIKTDTHWNAVGWHLNERDYPKNYNGSWEESLHEIVDEKLVKVQ